MTTLYVCIHYRYVSRWLTDQHGKPEVFDHEFRVTFKGGDLSDYLLAFVRHDGRTRSRRRLKAERTCDWYVEESAFPTGIEFLDRYGRAVDTRTPREKQIDQAVLDKRASDRKRVDELLARRT